MGVDLSTLTNEQLLALIEKISTSDLESGGKLNPEQSREFLRMVFDATPFSQLHRKERRESKSGEIDKIGVGKRLLRKKTEDVDDNYRAGISTSKIQYNCVPVRLPWEITEETLRQNIEGERFEDTVMQLMTKAVGVDLEDLHFNGDESSTDPFLSINNGWIKLIKTNGSHVIDHTAVGSKFNKSTFFAMMQELPNKYKTAELRWLMSPTRFLYWQEYLTSRATGAGDAALIGAGDQVNRPLGFPAVLIPSMPDDKMILTQPTNFIAVNTYDIRIRKTTEGREAVMQDKRFYVIHFDDDPVIEEYDAVVLMENNPTAVGDV